MIVNVKLWALTAAALIEFVRHDARLKLWGFQAVYNGLRALPVARRSSRAVDRDLIARAAASASLLYYKQVRCLQYSISLARLMRRHGYAADVVIGYRALPFTAHAWVEAGPEVYPKEPRLNRRLFQVLDRL